MEELTARATGVQRFKEEVSALKEERVSVPMALIIGVALFFLGVWYSNSQEQARQSERAVFNKEQIAEVKEEIRRSNAELKADLRREIDSLKTQTDLSIEQQRAVMQVVEQLASSFRRNLPQERR